MLKLVSRITIQQQPTVDYPQRSDTYSFDFVHNVEIVTSWENLSDTCEIIVPQKVYFRKSDGSLFSWQGKNIGGGETTAPVILRGDKITVELGYNYYDEAKKMRVTELNVEFEGWVSGVRSKKPMTIYAVDNMYKLTQVQAPNKTWTGYTVQGVIKEMLQGTGFTLKETMNSKPITTKVKPDIYTQNQTVAEVLEMIQRNYKLECFFRGNILYAAAFRYWPEDVRTRLFRFQYNVIADNLDFVRTDDVILGIQAYSFGKFQNGTTKDNRPKTKLKRYECFAIYNRGVLNIYDAKPQGWEGELRTMNLPAESLDELKKLVRANAYKLIYTGLQGNFTTFGLPSLTHGDNAQLIDEVMPDRNGTYKVRKVVKTFGVGGYRQAVTLDMRVDTLDAKTISEGL